MTTWHDVAHFLYGDADSERGFWYSHPLAEIDGVSEADLFWVPDPKCLCMLWHVGHIAHRERIHVGKFLQQRADDVIAPEYEIFGTEWCSTETLRESVHSVPAVLDWVVEVRRESTEFISSLAEDDFLNVLPTSDFGEGFSIAHWLFITVAHGAIHIGRIQMLRAMLEQTYDRTC